MRKKKRSNLPSFLGHPALGYSLHLTVAPCPVSALPAQKMEKESNLLNSEQISRRKSKHKVRRSHHYMTIMVSFMLFAEYLWEIPIFKQTKAQLAGAAPTSPTVGTSIFQPPAWPPTICQPWQGLEDAPHQVQEGREIPGAGGNLWTVSAGSVSQDQIQVPLQRWRLQYHWSLFPQGAPTQIWKTIKAKQSRVSLHVWQKLHQQRSLMKALQVFYTSWIIFCENWM